MLRIIKLSLQSSTSPRISFPFHRIFLYSQINTAPTIDKIRNVGIVAHIDAGKTTTSEQMLYACGALKSVGRVDSGDTVMDFLPQERERGITISSAATTFSWKDIVINLIDTPGHVDFTIEVERSARVLDGAIVVLDAVSGVQAQTKTVWKQVHKQKIPSIAFVNKMDRAGASYRQTLQSIRDKLGANPLPMQIPIGQEESFIGVIDLITMCKIIWPTPVQTSNSRTPQQPIVSKLTEVDDQYERAQEERHSFLEKIAENDDIFLDLFLNDEAKISEWEVIQAIRRLCLKQLIVPSFCGSSLKGKGVEPLLDSISAFLPSPLDRSPQIAVNNTNQKSIEISPSFKDLCAMAFKIVYDKERGPLVYIRIYSGSLYSKQMIRNSTRNLKERASQIFRVNADEMTLVDELGPGQVGCIVGLKETRTGDTLVVEKGPLHSFTLQGLSIPPPVYAISIEPEKSSQLNELEQAIQIISKEDPSLVVEFNKESGQTMLKGIGELHLEIVCDKLRRDYKIEVYTGRAYVAYRETIKSNEDLGGPIIKSITYNNSIGMKRMFATVEFQIVPTDRNLSPTMEIPPELKSKLTPDEYTSLIDGLQNAFNRGPLGYPVVGLHVKALTIEKDADTTPGAVRACAAILIDSILKNEDYREVIEPLMTVEIDVPMQYVGDVLSDLTVKRRGNITEMINTGSRNVIIAEVPLASMLGYATILRSFTHGEGIFSLEYSTHAPIDLKQHNITNF